MIKSKALVAAEAEIAALKTEVAAFQARLVVATAVFKNQRARINELEAWLNTRGVKPIAVKPQPVVTTFTRRDGTVCRKVRTGNTARIEVIGHE